MEVMEGAASGRLDSPSAERNKEPIWSILSTKVVPTITSREKDSDTEASTIRVLEVAAGTGVHSSFFVTKLLETTKEPDKVSVEWYATDPSEASCGSIDAYRQDTESLRTAIRPALLLTLDEGGIMEKETKVTLSKSAPFDFMTCINMIHISPWTATQGLMVVAKELLRPGGVLYTYGPYKVNGTTVESNLKFDASLQQRDPGWGVRNLEDVVAEAAKHGLELEESIEMPANNLSLLFRKPTA